MSNKRIKKINLHKIKFLTIIIIILPDPIIKPSNFKKKIDPSLEKKKKIFYFSWKITNQKF